MLLMFVAIIPGANLPGVLGGMVVQKIFFTVAGAFVYIYLFASVAGSFELQLPALHDHPVLALGILAGAGLLIVILGRIFWSKLRGLWQKAKQGGAILARPRDYFVRVALPSFGAYVAKLGVIAVFLAGYGITVNFHTVMSVAGRQLDREHGLGHARRRRRQPGRERRLARQRHRHRHGHGLLGRPAARDHGLEHRVRARGRAVGVRLGRRPGPGRALLCGRQGQGGRAAGGARREEGREASGPVRLPAAVGGEVTPRLRRRTACR